MNRIEFPGTRYVNDDEIVPKDICNADELIQEHNAEFELTNNTN